MTEALRNIPLEPGPMAAIRRLCDARGLPGGCRKAACRRARRCRAVWRPDAIAPFIVLPPCLLDVMDEAIDACAAAEERFHKLQRDVAMARGWPDPDKAAID